MSGEDVAEELASKALADIGKLMAMAEQWVPKSGRNLAAVELSGWIVMQGWDEQTLCHTLAVATILLYGIEEAERKGKA